MKITGNEPAMPHHLQWHGRDLVEHITEGGLTIRQQFAMAAMQALISNSENRGKDTEIAIVAIACADALINELNKSEK